jgi:hypothetical protein
LGSPLKKKRGLSILKKVTEVDTAMLSTTIPVHTREGQPCTVNTTALYRYGTAMDTVVHTGSGSGHKKDAEEVQSQRRRPKKS